MNRLFTGRQKRSAEGNHKEECPFFGLPWTVGRRPLSRTRNVMMMMKAPKYNYHFTLFGPFPGLALSRTVSLLYKDQYRKPETITHIFVCSASKYQSAINKYRWDKMSLFSAHLSIVHCPGEEIRSENESGRSIPWINDPDPAAWKDEYEEWDSRRERKEHFVPQRSRGRGTWHSPCLALATSI